MIEAEIDWQSDLQRLLKPGEVIRGESFKLNLVVTNLAENNFPGGSFTHLRITFGPMQRNYQSFPLTDFNCPEIPAKSKTTLPLQDVVPIEEGLAWIRLQIKAKDEKEIEYYQNPKDVIGRKEWINCFYVVNREMLHLISLSKELVELLRSRGRL